MPARNRATLSRFFTSATRRSTNDPTSRKLRARRLGVSTRASKPTFFRYARSAKHARASGDLDKLAALVIIEY